MTPKCNLQVYPHPVQSEIHAHMENKHLTPGGLKLTTDTPPTKGARRESESKTRVSSLLLATVSYCRGGALVGRRLSLGHIISSNVYPAA